MRRANLNRIVISRININSIRNKFELLAELMVTEKKLIYLLKQANLLYLVSLHHIVLTELKREEGYLFI